MAASTHNSNAYTDREKMFLIGPLVFGAIAIFVFLYVFNSIPSKPYALVEGHSAPEHSEPAKH